MAKKKSKTRLNYAIVCTAFGNIWIGTTHLEANNTSIFSNYDDAFEKAKHLASYDDVAEMESAQENNEIEIIDKNIEHFIVKD